MPFGLKNAPTTFQRSMETVSSEMCAHCCLVYLDDIICYSFSESQHFIHLQEECDCLFQAGFCLKEVKFLELSPCHSRPREVESHTHVCSVVLNNLKKKGTVLYMVNSMPTGIRKTSGMHDRSICARPSTAWPTFYCAHGCKWDGSAGCRDSKNWAWHRRSYCLCEQNWTRLK